MFGIGQSAKAIAIIAGILCAIIGVWYVSGLRADLAVSEENSRKLTQAVELQKEAMQSIIKDQNKIREINSELNDTVKRQTQDVTNLREKFSISSGGESRDIGKAAVVKPKVIESVINRASAKALRCMEIASGSPLTKDEINEKNSECPSLTGTGK